MIPSKSGIQSLSKIGGQSHVGVCGITLNGLLESDVSCSE